MPSNPCQAYCNSFDDLDPVGPSQYKDHLSRNGDSHVKDKTVSRPSSLTWDPYTGKMASLLHPPHTAQWSCWGVYWFHSIHLSVRPSVCPDEAKFMEMLTKENYSAAKKFNYTWHFIDDLHTLNNDGHLEENNNMGRIYPPKLKLNQENQNDDKATFLDLGEQIKNACIAVKTYDKRDAFKFEIINYPDLSGNITTKPAYGVSTSQVIHYARICSKKDDLLERVKSLTKKLLWKHYTINGLKSSLKKCLKKHCWIMTKLGPRLHQNLTEE